MARKPSKKKISVREAAKLVRMSPQGIYVAIKRGDIPATRIDGRIMVAREDVKAHRRRLDELMKPKPKVLSDEEFLRELWESDPD